MADLPIFRDKPNAESWDRDFIRKINALRDELESVKASSTSTSGSSSGRLTQLESKLNALEDEFQDHQNDISNFYHQVQHSQTLTAQGTTGDDNDDHDDRYYPSDNDGSDPTTNEKIFLREDVVGLSAGAVDVTASGITTDTSNFDNNLSSADDTVQKALETLDELAGGGGGGSYLKASLSVNQSSGLSVGDPIKLDTEDIKIGTNISLNTATYTITCAAGSQYEFSFSELTNFSAANSYSNIRIYDVTNSTYIGSARQTKPTTYTNNYGAGSGNGCAVTSVLAADTQYQLRFESGRNVTLVYAESGVTYLTVREL